MNRKRFWLIGLCARLLIIAFGLAGCSPIQEPASASLTGQWQLTLSQWAEIGRTAIFSITDDNGVLHGTYQTKVGYAGRYEPQNRFVYENGTFGGMVVKNEITLLWSVSIKVDGEETGTSLDYDLTGRLDGNRMSGKYHSKAKWGIVSLAKADQLHIRLDANEQDGQWIATTEKP
jgi:hypothetical protein